MQQPENARSLPSGRLKAALPGPGIIIPILALVLLTWLKVPASAESRYFISEKDSLIRLNADGSADVTEKFVFSLNGSINNLVMEIVKPANSTIILEKVISYGLGRTVACRPLESGQWDGTVFSDTYSVFDEADRFRVKAYYPYGRDRCVYYLQYRITQAVVRCREAADFVFKPIPGGWPTPVSHIRVRVVLPGQTANREAESSFRGVPSGKAMKTGYRMMDFDIPDTVPGEEPALRVTFPTGQPAASPYGQTARLWDQLRMKEIRLRQESALISLEARKAAAAEARNRSLAETVEAQVSKLAAVISVVMAAAGMVSAFLFAYGIRHPGRHAKMPFICRAAAFDGRAGDARNAGMLLFVLGLVIGVALVVWQGYLLLVPGCFLASAGNKAETRLKGTICLKSA